MHGLKDMLAYQIERDWMPAQRPSGSQVEVFPIRRGSVGQESQGYCA